MYNLDKNIATFGEVPRFSIPRLSSEPLGEVSEFRCALDPERTNAYHDFIEANVEGKVVMDLGCGSGILTWLCLKYGAKKVYAIDHFEGACQATAKICGNDPRLIVAKASTNEMPLDDFRDTEIFIHEMFGHIIFDEFIFKTIWNIVKQGFDINTIYPNKVEFFPYKASNWYIPDDVEYDPLMFRKSIRDFHFDYKETIEDWTDKQIRGMCGAKCDIEKIGSPIWTWDLSNRGDKINYCDNAIMYNIDEKTIERVTKKKYNSLGWRAWLGDYSYENIPRDLNNWAAPHQAPEYKKERLYNYIKDYYNNPFEEESCQFLR